MSDLNIVSETQGDSEWLAVKIGCLTASRVADALRKAKRETTGELQCRYDYKIELAVERLTNRPTEHYVSEWMERGKEFEPLARASYELRTNQETQQVGFVLHPSIEWAGCSPDGLVGKDGMVQFKVPKPSTHAGYLLGECVPEEYVPQMLWEMACCPGRAYSDFVSFCPTFPEPLDLFICRLDRDDKKIAAMEHEAIGFLNEVAETVERIKSGLAGQLRRSLHHPAADGAAALPSPKSTAAPSGASI